MSPTVSSPTVHLEPSRSHVARWVALLVVGYAAGTALLVRDFVVQSRTAPDGRGGPMAGASVVAYPSKA
ncbi:MAG TPA: hypothetical protein VMT11_08760 [Myxococcaceae bacterium]|nr:hypothetical protein [Myxococcaceae bacterium]